MLLQCLASSSVQAVPSRSNRLGQACSEQEMPFALRPRLCYDFEHIQYNVSIHSVNFLNRFCYGSGLYRFTIPYPIDCITYG